MTEMQTYEDLHEMLPALDIQYVVLDIVRKAGSGATRAVLELYTGWEELWKQRPGELAQEIRQGQPYVAREWAWGENHFTTQMYEQHEFLLTWASDTKRRVGEGQYFYIHDEDLETMSIDSLSVDRRLETGRVV